MRRNFNFIGGDRLEPSTDASYGMADIHDQRYWKMENKWPAPKSVSLSGNINYTITEGDHVQWEITGTTTGYSQGSLIYYTVSNNDGTTPIDIGTSAKGTVAVDASGNFVVYIGTNPDADLHFRGDFLQFAVYSTNWASLTGPTLSIGPINDSGGLSQNYQILNQTGTAIANTKNKYTSSHSFPAYGHPSGSSVNVTGYAWSDWGNDVFDGWGWWHFWNPTHGVAEIKSSTVGEYSYNSNFEDDTNVSVTASNWTNWVTEGSDGTINTVYFVADFNPTGQTNSSLRKHVKMDYGYIRQGTYIMHITFADYTWPFRFCMGGNMGSDGNTINGNQSGTYSMYSGSMTLYGNYNQQSGSSSELFSTYFIPRLGSQNAAINRGLSGDNLYLWTNEIKAGIDVYYVKGNWYTFASGVALGNRLLTQTTRFT